MGKGEENSDKSDDKSTPQTQVNPETAESEEETEEKAAEPAKQKEGETKKIDELRKVIKVDQKDTDPEPDNRENLEQKRAILQSIKDFDFQIKKNQEEITAVNKKLDSVTKDLDDLVSLYEIVSEQMNPFVGLSKVTKKRIDALENFTKEIDDLKNRLGDIESFAIKAGADLTIRENIKENGDKGSEAIEEKIKNEKEKIEVTPEIKEEIPVQKTIQEITIENKPPEIIPEKKEIPIQQTSTTNYQPKQEKKDTFADLPTNTFNSEHATHVQNSYDYFDEVIEKSLKMMRLDSQMDIVINEFIESLKA